MSEKIKIKEIFDLASKYHQKNNFKKAENLYESILEVDPNHLESNFDLIDGINCFVGKNGIGKTNVLDAIHYLCLTKSYYNSSDALNINFDNDYFTLKGNFIKEEDNYEIMCSLSKNTKKIIKINGKRYERFSDHIGKFPVVIISPTDSNLIIEGPDVRRRYLNSSISQFDNNYLTNLIEYNRALKQRNKLLKSISEGANIDNITIEAFNYTLSQKSKCIFERRKKFVEEINSIFQRFYAIISNSNEAVNLEYISHLNDNSMSELLNQNLEIDKISKSTTHGPHKDDISLIMDNRLIKKFGSQGQQKTFLVSLKLAQFELLEKINNIKPILLLDDIFDKLDNNRVEELLSLVDKGFFSQVFITDTSEKRCNDLLKKLRTNYIIFSL